MTRPTQEDILLELEGEIYMYVHMYDLSFSTFIYTCCSTSFFYVFNIKGIFYINVIGHQIPN